MTISTSLILARQRQGQGFTPASDLLQAVADRFRELQWSIETYSSPGIATKEVMTAVGPKRVLALWQKWPEAWLLTGEYWSENNNVVAPAVFLRFDETTTAASAAHMVDEFVREAMKRVDASYARRLYLEFDHIATRNHPITPAPQRHCGHW